MTLPVRRGGSAPERRRPTWGLWDPFGQFENLWGEMGRLLEGTTAPGGERPWMPVAEEEETEDSYVVKAELPGIPQENVTVELNDDELCIAGELSETQQGKALSRRTGHFSYRTSLPGGIDTERVEADLSEGMLTVRIPKSDRAKRRRIEISSHSSHQG